jgi:outer membrane protein assembly factor BamB
MGVALMFRVHIAVAAVAGAVAAAVAPGSDHADARASQRIAASSGSCSVAGRASPGAGRLEWKRGTRAPLTARGISLPILRAGNTLFISGVTSIDGQRRHGLAAIDLRTGRPLLFDPTLPANAFIAGIAVSKHTVWVAHGLLEDGPAGPKEIVALDRISGARIGNFAVADFHDGVVSGMAFAAGRVVIAGAPSFGPGPTLGAYDADSGAPVWRDELGWAATSMVTDGSRLYLGVRPEADQRLAVAFDAATGQPIADWGAGLAKSKYESKVVGVDPSRVFVATADSRGRPKPIALSRAQGAQVSLPRLPSNALELLSGTGRTILGRIRVPTHSGPPINIGAVFDTRGKLVGTVCSFYQVLAQVDDRHLLAYRSLSDQRSQLIYQLVRPRR